MSQPYGGSASDFAVYRGQVVPGQAYTVWTSDHPDRAQITDLVDYAGNAGAQVRADDIGMLRFQVTSSWTGPVYVTAAGGDGRLIRMDPANTYAVAAGAASDTAALSTRVDTAETTLATVNDEITALQAQVAAGAGSAYWFNVHDYGAVGDGVADDTAAIQAALNAVSQAGRGILVFPDGTYLIAQTLVIKPPGNIWIQMGRAATIRRSAASVQYLIANFDTSSTYTGYTAPGNIRLTGGIFDGAAGTFTTSCTNVIFAHASNIRVEGVTSQNVVDWHGLEINSSQDVVVRDCEFRGFNPANSSRTGSEACQIDGAFTASGLPGIDAAALDNTACDNVLFEGNTARGYGSLGSFGKLFGSDSTKDGYFHTNIRCVGNHGYGLSGYSIRSYNWKNVVIADNTFDSCNGGVLVDVQSGNTVPVERIIVEGNAFTNMGQQNQAASTTYAVISFTGVNSGTTVSVLNVVCANNVIKTGANTVGVYAAYCGRATFSGNTIDSVGGATGAAMLLDSCSADAITGNKINAGSGPGLVLQNTSSQGPVTGNVVTSPTGVGIRVADSNSVPVHDNVVSGAGSHGIYLAAASAGGSKYCSVQGNTILAPSGTATINGLFIEANVQYASWTGNTIQGYGTANAPVAAAGTRAPACILSTTGIAPAITAGTAFSGTGGTSYTTQTLNFYYASGL